MNTDMQNIESEIEEINSSLTLYRYFEKVSKFYEMGFISEWKYNKAKQMIFRKLSILAELKKHINDSLGATNG